MSQATTQLGLDAEVPSKGDQSLTGTPLSPKPKVQFQEEVQFQEAEGAAPTERGRTIAGRRTSAKREQPATGKRTPAVAPRTKKVGPEPSPPPIIAFEPQAAVSGTREGGAEKAHCETRPPPVAVAESLVRCKSKVFAEKCGGKPRRLPPMSAPESLPLEHQVPCEVVGVPCEVVGVPCAVDSEEGHSQLKEGFKAFDGVLIESVYGSHLAIDFVGGEVKGLYTPPSPHVQKGSTDDSPGKGSAVLAGTMRRSGGLVVFEGSWQHTDGPLSQGRFKMASPDITTPLFEGWWCEGVDADIDAQSDEELGHLKWKKWSWSAGEAISEGYAAVPSDDVTDDTKSSDDMTDDTKSVVSDISGFSEKAIAPWRTKANEFIASVYMERFTMVCVWLFFVQTVIQLMAAELELEIGVLLNCSFNAIYTALYASFLGIYAVMKRRPNKFYMIGVGLYFLGYATFTFIYASLLAVGDYHIALYHLGSWLFVIGSFLLVKATFPKKERRKTFERRFSPFRTDASCFWGSLCFLVGSFFFAVSAAGLYDGVSVGLSVFVAGRFYFVWGSQNKRCNFLMLHEVTANSAISYLRSASGTLMRSASGTLERATSGSLEMVRSRSGTLSNPHPNMMRSISKHLCPHGPSNCADGTGSNRWSPHKFLPGLLFIPRTGKRAGQEFDVMDAN